MFLHKILGGTLRFSPPTNKHQVLGANLARSHEEGKFRFAHPFFIHITQWLPSPDEAESPFRTGGPRRTTTRVASSPSSLILRSSLTANKQHARPFMSPRSFSAARERRRGSRAPPSLFWWSH